MSHLIKYLNTLKYLKPVQIYGRIFSILKIKAGKTKLPAVPSQLTLSLKPKTHFILHEPWNTREKLLQGKIKFLNTELDLGYPIHWNKFNPALLWQFNLHYFHYIHLLNEEEQIQICKHWSEHNTNFKSPAWHPYVTSLRIDNWCKAGIEDQTVNKSLYRQVAFLYRNLEYYHPANHYLENARALVFAGLYFKDQGEADKWLNKGLEIYSEEIPVQIFNDGGHFEKSTLYHAIMLEGILDIINILPEENKYYELFCNTASGMLEFLQTLTHPDGNITLFNDSSQEIAPKTDELIDYAERLKLQPKQDVGTHSTNHPPKVHSFIHSHPDTGYYIYEDKNVFLAIDGGSIGPDYIPAHSQAEIFTYELSVSGNQFIVNPGVYEYKAGEMRSYVRSTLSHNTVAIDGKDQAECWGGFRVARRYNPKDISFKEIGNQVLFKGVFDGYSKLIGDNLIHRRKIIIDKDSGITVEDEITGNGKHLVESYIHLHPEVEIEETDDYLILKRKNTSVKILIEDSEFEIEEGLYCPQFGFKIKNKVIKLYSNKLPVKFKYKIGI